MAVHAGGRGPGHIARVQNSIASHLALALDFTSDLDPRVALTRASAGTYFDSGGLLQSAATDVPRFNHDPATLDPLGLLLEGARTELILYNECASGEYWGRAGNVGTATNLDLDVFGTFQGVRMASAGAAWHRLTTPDAISLTNGTAYACRVRYQAGTSGKARIGLFRTTGTLESFMSGDVGALAVSSTASGTITILAQRLVGSTYEVDFTFTPNFTTTNYHLSIGPFSAVSGQNIIALSASLQVGSVPLSDIETSGSTATRSADTAIMSGSDFGWFSQAAGTLVAAFRSPGVGTRIIWQADDDTANERYTLWTDGTTLKFTVVDGGSTVAELTLGTITANTEHLAAVAFKTNDIAGCLDGGTVQTDASATLPTVDRLRLGADTTGNLLGGHISAIAAYRARLSDTLLQALTI